MDEMTQPYWGHHFHACISPSRESELYLQLTIDWRCFHNIPMKHVHRYPKVSFSSGLPSANLCHLQKRPRKKGESLSLQYRDRCAPRRDDSSMPGSESGKYADHMVRHRVAPCTYYHNLGATFLETTNIQVTMGRIRSNFV